ncbi:hypothetical protein [Apilactobacillus micheneri]|uniref:hypothetical protein n=1 Tax=Apilactobacillus micheneri TaxID=1899430 RepID=UPI00112EA812|nr:hypothetical protein [Apilactobacillus micheneri]TPR43335.1 hypothetical protein DY128_07350 [Apilactobacillus micheneri]
MSNNSNEIITQIINSIENGDIDLKNVPALQKEIEEYRIESQNSIKNIEKEIKKDAKGISENLEDQVLDATKKYYNHLKKDSANFAEDQKIEFNKKLNELYNRASKTLNNDTDIQNIKKEVLTNYQQSLAESKELIKQIDARKEEMEKISIQQEKRVKRIEQMSYFQTIKSFLSVFIGTVLPTIIVLIVTISLCYFFIKSFM